MLDIFRKEPLGGVLWMGTPRDEDEVRTIFKKLRAVSPGVYFTFDRSREPSASSSPKSSARAFSSNRPPFWALSLLNDLPILDQRGEVWGLFLLSRIEIHVTPITVLAL